MLPAGAGALDAAAACAEGGRACSAAATCADAAAGFWCDETNLQALPRAHWPVSRKSKQIDFGLDDQARRVLKAAAFTSNHARPCLGRLQLRQMGALSAAAPPTLDCAAAPFCSCGCLRGSCRGLMCGLRIIVPPSRWCARSIEPQCVHSVRRSLRSTMYVSTSRCRNSRKACSEAQADLFHVRRLIVELIEQEGQFAAGRPRVFLFFFLIIYWQCIIHKAK